MNPQDYTITEENGEMYAQFFLYNNEMNDAGDPINYKVYPENNEKIAKSFIGRPYVLPAKDDLGRWINKHFRADSLEATYKGQKKYAAGEIVKTPFNPETGNYNAVVKVFPEYHETFRQKKIPAYTSPMFAHSDSYIDEDGKLHIKDGIGVHLHGVTSPGYPPELSSVVSICEAGLNDCMRELQTVAASGNLITSQETEHFSNDGLEDYHTMSQALQKDAPAVPPQVTDGSQDRVGALEIAVAELSKQLQMILQKMSGQTNLTGDAALAGAASEQVTEVPEALKEITAELESVKAERLAEKELIAKEREEMFLKERKSIATAIVESKLKLHKIAPEAKEAEIEKLVGLKSGENYVDLSLLADELKDSVNKLVGASGGMVVSEIPELGDNENQAESLNGHELMEKFSR